MKTNDNAQLSLTRFCGVEYYPVVSAEWSIIDGDESENDPYQLWLYIKFAQGTKLHEDTKQLAAAPHWDLSCLAKKLVKSDIIIGLSFELDDEIENDAIFYYCEHEPTTENKIKILDVDGDWIKVELIGKTMDVNYYDGSKPLNELSVTAWFKAREPRSK